MINTGILSNILGVLLLIVGGMMLTALPFSIYYADGMWSSIVAASLVTMVVGGLSLYYRYHTVEKIGKREGYLAVAFGWISMGLAGMLPYLFSGVLTTFPEALFESISGLTTTGASVLADIEAVPPSILFWRSLTQWIGGMGIIVLTVAIFPLLGIGGVELFVAEAPGPTSDKIHPRIKETAKRLWLIYVGLTFSLTLIFLFCGMSFYDAINHGLTTMATGGFSTKNASMAHFGPTIQYWTILFMFFAGVNYTVIYYSLQGKFDKVWRSDEFKTYLGLTLFLSVAVTSSLVLGKGMPIEQAFRDATFQIVSLITTTGFVSADYTSWSAALSLVFFCLLFLGACAGSTSGGIKIIRHMVFFKNSILEFKRILHPRALIRPKIDGQLVAPKIRTHILSFLLIYLFLFVFGSLVMAIILADFQQPFLTAIGSVATSLGNVGPAIGEVGPVDNFASIPPTGKVFLVFLMLLGRLELFTVLVLFTPYFWRLN
ncbi:MAG: TrkH family potassium uptake protein [Bacteroidota bacterium]